MSNVAEELKKILTIEETIFTIDRVVSEIVNITNSLPSATSKQPPLKPSPPIKTASMCIQTIPAYDEKAYLVKAKKEEHAKYSKFRENCAFMGFFLIQTFIGIVICWIPWVVALCSFPFQVTGRRKAAYKIYIRECSEIEEGNILARKLQEKYNIDFKQYEYKYKQYEIELKQYEQEQHLLQSQKQWLADQSKNANIKAMDLHYLGIRLCNDLKFPTLHRKHTNISVIYYIITQNPSLSISEAVKLYEKMDISETQLISSQISFDMCQRNVQKICKNIQEHLNLQKEKNLDPLSANYPKTLLEKLGEAI